jgi:hypothetical protein
LQNEINGSSEDVELSVSMSRWRNETSFGRKELETLVSVACEGKEWYPFSHPMIWANEIWIALLLVIFLTLQEMSRALGKDKLRLIFFGR